MDKYIKQLLELYSKVILPKFGAIVIENEETGELMFNEYLNYNDGKLDELIEKESNMELQEAQNMIAKYIRDIQTQIDKGETYDIFDLGGFSKNKDGEIEFSGNIKTGESKTKDVSEVTSPTPPTEKIKEEPVKSEEKLKKEKGSPAKKEEKKEGKESKKENKYEAPKPASEKKKNTDKDSSSAKESLKKEAAAKKEEVKKAKSKKAAALKADKKKAKEEAKKAKAEAKKAKKKEPKVENKKNEKSTIGVENKKRRLGVTAWIAIILLVIVAGGSIYVGLNYDKVKSYMGWSEFEEKRELAENKAAPDSSKENEEKTESESQEVQEKIENTVEVQDEETSPEPKETAQKEVPTPASETNNYSNSNSSGSYHLIAGGFSVKSNAEDKVNELKSKGFPAKILGRINGLHFVSAKSYTSFGAAKQDVDNVRSQSPGAWIYKY
jgi:DNA polymerase III gamma/tau subunit